MALVNRSGEDGQVGSVGRSDLSARVSDDDRIIQCAKCRTAFVWTQREQQFYFANRLLTPRRCQPCRDARKRELAKAALR